MKPRVSVIIPAYNAEKYLSETLESVRGQTYREYEVIVVDDGSSDRTLEVARNFEPRVKVFSKQNGGPASARNLAIKNSTGDYIAFLDSDDLWLEKKLEMQVALLDRRPEVGLTFGEALMFSENVQRTPRPLPRVERDLIESQARPNNSHSGRGVRCTFSEEKKIEGKIGFTGEASFRLLLFGDYIPNSTVMIRRASVDAVGLLNESRELIAVEDYEYWMRIANKFPIEAIPAPLAYYRIRDGNLMGDGRDINKGLKLSISALREIERLYPNVWEEQQVDRDMLFARLHVRAGFAWKQRKNWQECSRKFVEAIGHSSNPQVFRWIAAAMLLKRWS